MAVRLEVLHSTRCTTLVWPIRKADGHQQTDWRPTAAFPVKLSAVDGCAVVLPLASLSADRHEATITLRNKHLIVQLYAKLSCREIAPVRSIGSWQTQGHYHRIQQVPEFEYDADHIQQTDFSEMVPAKDVSLGGG
jgi:hypothetical protein